jgi:MoaA/NifB/PqqE/SkfB family radical SAM enzyme
MYGENDELEPDTEFVSSEHRYQREYFELTNRIQKKPWIVKNLKFFKNTKTIDNIKPLCHIGTKGIFITSQGDFYPCCWTANRYTHNTRWQDISKTFNLYNNNLEDVLKNKIWEKDFLQDQHECRIKCSDNQVTEKYAVHRV